ncbi:tetratricopeptide repeat protein [Candidatus Karelsulcia muelleri]|uniref:tetratricopeptide repeat protein n=1 Tax=Candidatus Karelsulcia muelleri TaxID=336810 RepID=UPI000D7BBBAC|nr:tetratricopeptide repeat protein [Candidatus Karelsulcia muelleri]
MFNTYLKKIFYCLEKEKIFNKINNFYENKIQLMKVFIKKKTKENVWLQKFLKKILKEEITKKIENKHINNYRLIINAYNCFHKRKSKEALNIFEKLLSEERISFLKNKKFYKNIMFKTALCNFYLKKYDEAIFYFNLILKNSNINHDIETEMNYNKIELMEKEKFFSDNDLISELNNEDLMPNQNEALIFEKKLLKKLKQEKILSAEDVQKIYSIINNETFFSEKDAKKILSNIDKTNMIYSYKAEENKNFLDLKDLFLEKEEDAFLAKLSKKKILSEKEEKEIYSKLKQTNFVTINNEKFFFSEKNKKFILLNFNKICSGKEKQSKEKQSLFSKLKSEETSSEETSKGTGYLPNPKKELKKETYKERKANSKEKQKKPLEVTLFNLGMCYSKQANDYNFDQQNNLKSIKVFLKFIKSYPNSLKLKTAKKMLYKAVLNFKKKQISIGNFYLKRKKYKASLLIFKDNIENFKKLKKIFSIQNEYIYMIISQYKLEKSTNQFDFKKTLKLYNDYIHNFYNFENQFFYEKKLNLDYRIKNLFSKIERQLFFLKISNQYRDEYQRI